MADASVLRGALGECWAAEVSGIAYYEALGQRFPEHRYEFDTLALVERTTSELIEAVARRCNVTIDHGEAERIGVEVAQMGNDWGEVLENALSYTPATLRMYQNLADELPEEASVVGQAVVGHERAQIVLFESVVAGKPDDWSAIDAFLERHATEPKPRRT